MSPNDEQYCINCKFFLAALQQCRRHAPIVYLNPSSPVHPVTIFPKVYELDWCGDWVKTEIPDAPSDKTLERPEQRSNIEWTPRQEGKGDIPSIP